MTLFRSLFDVIGPIMIGPSSSHTAGAVRIGLAARSLFGELPDSVDITLYGSFAHTYKGHGTDLALVAGLMGYSLGSAEIKHARRLADEAGLVVSMTPSEELTEHPNTAKIVMKKGSRSMSVTGISTGGGLIDLIEIDGFNVHVSGEEPVILVFHRDRPGLIAQVTRILAAEEVNVSQMEVSRKARGETALMLIATDGEIPRRALQEIEKIGDVKSIIFLSALTRQA
ncbi:MAG TPA: L-serine ammonia-lyase, iron-sulfur-dependent subunit beta [Bacillota bacterium]|jgi:L-serine dehydratase|nr:L-serine ammonia-lyase, iron-sulfur-dependent, subunit beta [Fastidiosipila sp.]HPX92970.1 L-serine ammonia-lyase, iron-sulfur-dependent subunit beta [Bacillota bacterium]HQB80784.1 L-serine ammonia-lyase, iron-sulfur-dependent subunit beta [Bacillota bacterium]